ncbi:HAUS augmin-like complex subunit 6 N-terminus-domain-containing protein [Microdochium bolleyi]|uniref:HAUS augmin-like complex subunit 6 N-terminus-domain-containing protein n=1 Tax=Microdochium bolleyi TaxID=196109 RepID=A0A136ITH1_9PEZI|nr:HAUS augmin-like complex subunit 6 N-terminus-domain-containing protein [Microdochium bolleyi]
MSLFAPSSNPPLARTRTLRPATRAPLTAPQQAQQGTTAGRSLANGAAGSGQQDTSHGTATAIPSSTSNLALFLTNLRLLDLDLEPDWPDITPATFSSRDAAGGQKKRIQAVEWALFQLFVLWDPSETQNKLRPFFPPLEQVQSVNLRATLTRSLEQLKRNGFLGRDAIIRKTMLDECKGDRLEEVLAAFSSAVLKKLVTERNLNSTGPDNYPPIAEKIAVENRGYTGERTELNALLLAHKVVLSRALEEKNEERARYRDFEELLELKQRGLVRRREQVKASSAKTDALEIDDQTRAQARDVLRTNWTGNESWVDTLLFAGADVRPSTLLDVSFDEVWSSVQQGRLSDLEEQGSDLLGHLDHRVKAQRARLEKWETFHEKMFGAQKAAPVTPKRKQDRPKRIVEFRAHKNAHLSSKARKAADDMETEEVPVEYDQIMVDMERELGKVGQAKIPNFAKMFGSTAARIDEPELPPPRPALEPERTMSQPARASRQETSPRRRPSQRSIPKRQDSRHLGRSRKPSVVEDDEPTLTLNSAPALDLYDEPSPTRKQRRSPERQELPMAQTDAHDDIPQKEPSPLEPEFPVPASPPPPASPIQAAADEILAYMSNASPSPSKKTRHTLSLAERTRLSMSRGEAFDPDDGRLSPAKPDYPIIVEEPVETAAEDGDYGTTTTAHEDLIARTRRSMAGFEAARQKAQLERRRSQRRSKVAPRREGSTYFPRVDEDGEGAGDTSVIDELLLQADSGGGEVDYEAVFRSRPKIKTSPAASPMRRWAEE